MGKEGEFKYKEKQRLVESEPENAIADEVLADDEAKALSAAAESGAAANDEAVKEPVPAKDRSHKPGRNSSHNSGQNNSKRPAARPKTGVMVLALSCVFVGILVPASTAFHVGRASLRAQIGALFGGSSNEGQSAALDLVEVLYQKCEAAYRRNQKPETVALDAALDRAVKMTDPIGMLSKQALRKGDVQSLRLGVLMLRQASSAVFRGDKKLAAELANKAMLIVPENPSFDYSSVSRNTVKDALTDAGVHLNQAGQYAAAIAVLEARLAYRSTECLEGIREELGNSYYHTGDYKNAYRCYQEAFDEAKGPCLGKDPSSMRRMGEMGSAKVKMHEYQEAVSCFKRTFGFFSDRFGENGIRYTMRFVPLYAEALMATGDYAAAEQLLQKSMTEMKQNYPRRDHWAYAQQQLAAYYQHANKPKEAATILDALIKEVREGNPGPSIDELTHARNALGVD